jgi:hypothetical protein
MSVSYEQFFSNVMPEVPGCPEITAFNAIQNSAIEFCEKSLVLQRDHDPVTVVANIVDYDLEPPPGYLVVKVMRAWLEGNELTALAPDMVKGPEVYNRLFTSYNAQPTTPTAFLQKDVRTVSIWGLPDKKYINGLTMRVALKPTRAAETIEDEVYEDYCEAIAAGALARLLGSQGKPYSSRDGAALADRQFRQAINVARQRATHGNVRSTLSVQLRKP